MEEQQKALNSFVQVHANKLAIRKDKRVAHLVNYSVSGIPLNITLTQYTLEDLREANILDDSSPLVHWLFQQIQTYDIDRENIIGLIFDKKTVLAHVVKLKN